MKLEGNLNKSLCFIKCHLEFHFVRTNKAQFSAVWIFPHRKGKMLALRMPLSDYSGKLGGGSNEAPTPYHLA